MEDSTQNSDRISLQVNLTFSEWSHAKRRYLQYLLQSSDNVSYNVISTCASGLICMKNHYQTVNFILH